MSGKLGMRHKQVKYNKKLASRVLELMEQGKSLSQLCEIINAESPIDLKPYQVLGWRRHHEDFKAEYELAYDSRSALWSDELYTIASLPLPSKDKLELAAETARRRLIIDVLKTLLNKHRPTVTPSSAKVKGGDTVEVQVVSYD